MATAPTASIPVADHAAIYDAAVRMGRVPTIVDYMDRLPWFQTGAEWTPWRVFLKAVYALPMNAEELDLFRRFTKRRWPPAHPVKEVFAAVGRRGRKTAVMGLLAFYQAICRPYREHLAEGERAWALTLSTKIDDARKIHENVNAILDCPALRHFRGGDPTATTIPLRVGVDVHVRAANLMAGRGRALVFAGLDEFAFLPSTGSAVPDEEVLRGIRPAMANVDGALLAAMSSPYAMRGELYRAYEEYYGQEDPDNLFWMADTISMHDTPRIRMFVAGEYAKDPVSAASEFGTPDAGIVFRKDVAIFISPEIVKACTVSGRKELGPCSMRPVKAGEPEPRRFHYFAFVDVSGGAADSYTLAIAHWDRLAPRHDGTFGKAVLDLVREWPAPFDPKQVTKEAAALVKAYHLNWVTGDAYAGVWPQSEWSENDVGYHISDLDKHHIYKATLPTLNARAVELLDDTLTNGQLKDLDRRVTPTGQERIDHKPLGHDDRINAAAGALELAYRLGPWQDDPQVAREITTTEEIVEREMREMEEEQSYQDGSGEDVWHGRWNQ